MIVTFWLNNLFLLIVVILTPILLLPNASLPVDLNTSLVAAGSYLKALDYFFPISTLFTILALYIVIEGGIMLWKLINWGLKKIPTIS